jgi:UDP-N-acetylglucosamine transferase subunit ALG13
LISVGTSRMFPFDRLVGAADHIKAGAPIVVQRGPSRLRPPGAEVVDFMLFDELSREMAYADAVVTHAGIGSVLLALMHGHQPIVMARQSNLGECVDEHQEQFAQRLDEEQIAVVIHAPEEVEVALRAIRNRPGPASPTGQAGDLLECIAQDVRAALGDRSCATS